MYKVTVSVETDGITIDATIRGNDRNAVVNKVHLFTKQALKSEKKKKKNDITDEEIEELSALFEADMQKEEEEKKRVEEERKKKEEEMATNKKRMLDPYAFKQWHPPMHTFMNTVPQTAAPAFAQYQYQPYQCTPGPSKPVPRQSYNDNGSIFVPDMMDIG